MTVHPFHAVPMDFNTWPPTDTRSSNPTNPEPCTHGRQRTPEVQILQKNLNVRHDDDDDVRSIPIRG